jgi:hypothetical protein
MNKPKRALSIKQTAAEMILQCKKKVEYRTIPTNIRERVYIYASKKPRSGKDAEEVKAHPEKYPTGVLVGTVEITGCTKKQEKKYQWHLAKPERLPKNIKPENRPQPVWFHPFKEEDHCIVQFRRAIRRLPSDEPRDDPNVWYKTQKEHWLGWLKEYGGPGAYGRIPGQERDARFAYNHIVNHQMLLWIIDAAGVGSDLVKAARRAAEKNDSMMAKSAAIRKLVPWEVLADALWAKAEKE